MPKKKEKASGPQQKVDVAKLQEDARQHHVHESTTLVLENARQCQKELVGEWIQEAVGIKKKEMRENLERQIGELEGFLESANEVVLSRKWEFQDADEALDAASQTHEQTHQELTTLQQNRIKSIETYFKNRLQALKDFFLENIKDITETHSKFKTELQNLIQMIALEDKQKRQEQKQEETAQFEFIRNRAIEGEHQLQSQLEQKIKTLKEQIETALQSYRAATDDQAVEYRRLLHQDQSLSKQVHTKMREVEKMQAAISHWRAKVSQHKQDFESRNSRIRGEVDQLRKQCKELRDEMEAARSIEKQRLLAVSLCARDSKERLMEQLKLADKIHRVAALCSKYERKEVPEEPPKTNVTETDTSKWTPENQKLHRALKELMDARGDEWGVLNNVFSRISRVTLEA